MFFQPKKSIFRFIAELLDYFVQSWQLSFHNYPSLAALWIAHATTQTTSTCVLQEHGCNTDPFFGMSRFYRISWLQKYFSTFQSGNICRTPCTFLYFTGNLPVTRSFVLNGLFLFWKALFLFYSAALPFIAFLPPVYLQESIYSMFKKKCFFSNSLQPIPLK